MENFHRREMKAINEGGGGKRDDLYENIRGEKKTSVSNYFGDDEKGRNNVFFGQIKSVPKGLWSHFLEPHN